MKKSTWLCFVLLLLCQFSFAQTSVPFPTGPRDYEAVSPWGYTNDGTTWDTGTFLPFIYRNMWFRFMPPNGVTYNKTTNTWTYTEPTKKYPLILFFQGAGEAGGTDNNKPLKHGGQRHRSAVLSDEFPGFLLYPQGIEGTNARALLEKIIATYPIDVNRIYVHGLSNGAKWAWDFTLDNPTLIAGLAGLSGMSATPQSTNLLYTPIRQSQGGLDTNPAPNWTQAEFAWYESQGGQMEYFLFPTLGHGTWNNMFNRSDWFTWFLSQKKNKIYVRYRKNEFCPGTPVSATLGFTPGFDAYEWRRDGIALPNTTHAITVTTYGSYTGRIRNRGVWSVWSDPVVVGDKAPTQTPPIQVTQLQSRYIPDVNGNSNVGLTLPDGYETYTWSKSGVTEPIGNTQSITVSSVGSYTAVVKEVGGCSSLPSTPFTIIDANGAGKPDAAANLQVSTVSKTQLRLNWEQTQSPSVNETGFEVYRSATAGGPYTLLAVTAADVVQYADNNLAQNSRFYYVVRAISATAAAAATPEASGVTDVDITPPSAPNNLAVTSIGSTNVNLSWSASSDDVGVTGYDVYVRQSGQTNYTRAYFTTSTSQNVFGLSTGVLYNFIVKAKDVAGNESSSSAMVVAATVFSGLRYSYYEYTGTWSVLPNFDALTPVSTGVINNFSLSPAAVADRFAFRFTGTLYVPANNQYTFYLTSDDGSKLWVNNTLVVNHDGVHGSSERSGAITLNAGYYPIKVEYFEGTSSNVLQVRWSSRNINKQLIPDANLRESYTMPTAPSAPSGASMTVLDYKSLRVNWSTYTGTGTDIEVYRSSNGSSNWVIIGTVPATQNSFVSAGLAASTRYYYRLRAINSGNVSSFSSTVNATTTALPAKPLAPSNLVMSNIGANTVTLTWTDNSTNEDNFELYKSTDNTTFAKVATLPANVNTYVDNGVFAHTLYYYKVWSKNVSGNSNYSNTVNGTTLNNAPTLAGLRDVTLRYDEVVDLELTGTDPDNDFLVIGGNVLPEYAQLFDYGDGTAVLKLQPTLADMGEHNGLQIFVQDAFGGVQTLNFKVVVNSNHSPVIAALDPLTLRESFIGRVTATATDGDSDPITWSFENQPAFMSFVTNGNAVDLKFQPGLTDAGTYNVTLKAADPNGGLSTQVLQVVVDDYDPNFNVKVNFRTEASFNGPAGWNNIGTAISTTALVKENNTASGISLNLVQAWSGWKDNAGVTPGVYPDAVNGSHIYFYVGEGPKTLRLTGLNVDGKYNLKFLASNRILDGASRLTTFAVNGQTQSIQANSNASTLVAFSSLVPNASGELSVAVTGPAGGYAVVNAMVIESFFDGNVVPPAPTALEASISASQLIQLNWTDNAINEASYEVYRSTDNTNFTKIATLPLDAGAYTDASFSAGVTYYFKVRGINGIGASGYSNTVNIVGPNRAPVVSPINALTVAEMGYQTILLQATDTDGDTMEFSLEEGAPSFVWTEYAGNGRANLMIAPMDGDRGNYQFEVRCTDNGGAVGVATVQITVTGGNEATVSVNFTTTSALASAPWNNVTGYTAGTVLSALKDANNVSTTMALTVQTTWVGTNPNGYTTGNNSGVYPDAVMSNSFYVQDNTARNLLLTGLSPTKLYDFTFYASRMSVGDARETRYTVGSKSAVLNASNNQSNLARVTGIAPNGSGQITIAITKEAASQFGYLNSLVIREYEGTAQPATPLPPTNLTSQVMTKTSSKLIWSDASDNETGFEIWRSAVNNTSYSLLTTTAANATTYTNTGLASNTTYYYKVRAINAAGVSLYSNESNATTYDYSISVNFNAFNTGPTTWNNISAFLSTGAVVTSLRDESGVNTGVSMTVMQEFTGDNPFGNNTGNNSGIVPDRVMEGSWWIDRAQVAILKFSNLSFLKKYNFSFFASRAADGDRNTVYIINGNSVTLNASNNTTNLVQLKNITPDADGTVTVNITTTSTALFGYLNGIIIQAIPADAGGAGGSTLLANEAGAELKAYPNPFTDRISVNVGNDESSKFNVSLVNASGIVVHEEQLERTPTQEDLEVLLRNDLSQGIYMLRVKGNAGSVRGLRLFRK